MNSHTNFVLVISENSCVGVLASRAYNRIRVFGVFLLHVILLAANFCWGQNTITFTTTNGSFSEFVKSVEERTPYLFYYHPEWTDSLTVTISVADADLRDVLTEVLKPTDLSFAIASDNKVFITKGKALLTYLPKGVIPKDNFEATDDNFDATVFDKKVKKAIGEEAKVYVLGAKSAGLTGNAAVTGYVRLAATGEPLPGVSVFLPDPLIGVATDALGQFSLTIPKGKRVITIQGVGLRTTNRTLMLYEDGKLDVELEEEITALKEVVISSEQEAAVTSLQMGKEKLDIRSMKQMPLALGETDVMKIVLTLPGVQTVGEGANGLNVRGGASNQNLILFNGATVYNPSHLFGFFSTFNPDVLKSIELYKSGFEANLGGRLSSVLNVMAREGNLKKFTATGGIAPSPVGLRWRGQ
jgi:CarboxypepD_reg-like domain/TonB-dependent Receptor Plug Domain